MAGRLAAAPDADASHSSRPRLLPAANTRCTYARPRRLTSALQDFVDFGLIQQLRVLGLGGLLQQRSGSANNQHATQ